MTSISSESVSMSNQAEEDVADVPPATDEPKEINRAKIMGNTHDFATMREIVTSPDSRHNSPEHSWDTTTTSHEHIPHIDHHVAALSDKISGSAATAVVKHVDSSKHVHIPDLPPVDTGRPRNMSSIHGVFSPPTVHIHENRYHHDPIVVRKDSVDPLDQAHNHDPSMMLPASANPAAHDAPAASILVHNHRSTMDPLANHVELTHRSTGKYKSRAGHISNNASKAGMQTPQSKQSIISEFEEHRDRRSSSAVHPNTAFHNTVDATVKDEEFKKHQEEVYGV